MSLNTHDEKYDLPPLNTRGPFCPLGGVDHTSAFAKEMAEMTRGRIEDALAGIGRAFAKPQAPAA